MTYLRGLSVFAANFTKLGRLANRRLALPSLAHTTTSTSSHPPLVVHYRSYQSFPERFRTAYDYAQSQNMKAGLPHFQAIDNKDGKGIVYQTTLLSEGAAWEDISAAVLNNPSTDAERFRAIQNYAHKKGFVGGYPNFHKRRIGEQLVYGTTLLSGDVAKWDDVPAKEIGSFKNDEQLFILTHNYARKKGFITGFPNFHKREYPDRGLVYGTIFIKPVKYKVDLREVPVDILNMFANYSFATGISREQRLKVLQQHARGYLKLFECNNLKPDEKAKLLEKYRTVITHGINSDPTANASATVGGSHIDINFNVLFPQGDDEIGQSLIHEMTHCAGFTHPPKSGKPYDGGKYYSSPPLRAELCIVGQQSLVDDVRERNCDIERDKCTIKLTK